MEEKKRERERDRERGFYKQTGATSLPPKQSAMRFQLMQGVRLEECPSHE